jgi:heptosyltransferase-2
MEKILIWQTAFLGDLILTTPLISSLKEMFPDASVDIVTKPFGKDVLKENPYINEVIIFDKNKNSTLKLIKTLKERKYSLAISPHRSHRASYVLFLSGIPERVGFDKGGFSFLYTKTVPHRFDGTHEIDRNLSLLKPLKNYSEKKIKKYPQIFLTQEEDDFYKKIGLKDKGYILVAPGSKWETKRWTAEGFSQLINILSERETVVLFGGKEDRYFVDEIKRNLKREVIDIVGKTSLRESFSVVKHSKALISNDSAPVHMAVSFGVPVVDIYGPTVKDFGFYPYRNGVVVEVDGLSCRPCGLHGHKKCPTGTFECMKNITPDMILKALKDLKL